MQKFYLILLALFLFQCSEDETNPKKECKLLTYGQNQLSYDAQGRAILLRQLDTDSNVLEDGGKSILTYDGVNRLTKIDIHYGAEYWGYVEYEYADNLIIQNEYWPVEGAMTKMYTLKLTLNDAGKVTRVDHEPVDHDPFDVVYEYDNRGNVIRFTTKDSDNVTRVTEQKFDDHPSPFSATGMLIEIGFYNYFTPTSQSSNNVIERKTSVDGGTPTVVTYQYQYNEEGLPTSYTTSTGTSFSFGYDCD